MAEVAKKYKKEYYWLKADAVHYAHSEFKIFESNNNTDLKLFSTQYKSLSNPFITSRSNFF